MARNQTKFARRIIQACVNSTMSADFAMQLLMGISLIDPKGTNEETQLSRDGTPPAKQCHLAINEVLEPMWARLLLYAKSLEKGTHTTPVKRSGRCCGGRPLLLSPSHLQANKNRTSLTVILAFS